MVPVIWHQNWKLKFDPKIENKNSNPKFSPKNWKNQKFDPIKSDPKFDPKSEM